MRLGRLIGVLIKEPFAVPQTLPTPSSPSGACRSWELVGPEQFATHTANWQSQALEIIRTELTADEPYVAALNNYELAKYAHDEMGFFGFFARSLGKYLCGDKKIRKKVDDAVKAGAKLGNRIPALTPETIVGAGGLSLGAYLVQHVPVLGIAGAPVVAAVVLILYTLGVDAFCKWSVQLRTGDDEKH